MKEKKLTKKDWLGVGLLVLVLLFLVKRFLIPYYILTRFSDIEVVKTFGPNQEYVLVTEGDLPLGAPEIAYLQEVEVGGRYLLANEFRRNESVKDTDVSIDNGEFHRLLVYDLNKGGKLGKTIDLHALLSEHYQDFGTNHRFSIYEFEGREYLDITLFLPPDGVNYVLSGSEDVLIDIETEEVISRDDFINAHPQLRDRKARLRDVRYHDKNSFINTRLMADQNVQVFFDKISSADNLSAMRVEGTNFSKLYPEIASYFQGNKPPRAAIFVRRQNGSRDDAAWFDTLLHWFAPLGEEVLTLEATDSKTGETGTIASYEDYKLWLEKHPEVEEDTP